MTLTDGPERLSKTCRRCGGTKPLGEFHRRAHSRDGRAATCKPCIRLDSRRYYEANRDAVLRRNAAWASANKERIVEYGRAYRTARGDAIEARKRAYRQANRLQLAAKERGRYAANRDAILARSRATYLLDGSRRRAIAKWWYRDHKDDQRAARRDWYLDNRDRVLARMRAYKISNPGVWLRAAAHSRERSARINAGATNRGRRWTWAEDALVLSGDLCLREIANLLSRSVYAVAKRRYKLRQASEKSQGEDAA